MSALAAVLAAGTLTAAKPPRALRAALESITAEDLLRHIRVLASDEFEGRAPGTAGEDKTVGYLAGEFVRMGLEPGGTAGSWFQPVPLMGLTAQVRQFSYQAGDRTVTPNQPEEAVVWTRRFVPEVREDESEIVFVGYGVVAPEYNWDDYKGLDVRGKTLLMLINDPAVPDPRDPAQLDPRWFEGRAMTYYGRWTYKFEIAAQKGAAAALIIHEEGPAGYPWSVVAESNTGEQFELARPDGNADRVAIEGWVTRALGAALCAAGGQDLEALKHAAVQADFRPVPLGVQARFAVRQSLRQTESRNVLARLTGADPRRREEVVVLTAHWDHLGRDPGLSGDQIYNGALDNASGVAALLEVAEAAIRLPRRPARTLLFLLTTAEEQGLLGAAHYAVHPLHPLERTVANLNVDVLNPYGRTRDVEVVGLGRSTLDEVLQRVAAAHDRVVRPDSEPEKGRFYRSDHFMFAKRGVPAMYLKSGIDFRDRPPEFGPAKVREYVSRHYHRVSDEIQPDWDLSGAAEDTRLLFHLAWAVAQARTWPAWKPGSEFQRPPVSPAPRRP